jgi:predicted TIM-barrel fold metal-dependent hydrolase
MFWPNGFLYAMNLERIPEQLVFGSAFPFCDMKTYVEETFKLQKEHDVSDATMEKYLYSNAARLLKVNEAGERKPDGSVAASVPA